MGTFRAPELEQDRVFEVDLVAGSGAQYPAVESIIERSGPRISEFTVEFSRVGEDGPVAISSPVPESVPSIEARLEGSTLFVEVLSANDGGFQLYQGDFAGFRLTCRDLREETYELDLDRIGLIDEPSAEDVSLGVFGETTVVEDESDDVRIELDVVVSEGVVIEENP